MGSDFSAYEYSIQYRPGSRLGNADALSRLPLADQLQGRDIPPLGDVSLLVKQLSHCIVSATPIAQWTDKDSTLSLVHHFVLHSWPDTCPDSVFLPYFHRKE